MGVSGRDHEEEESEEEEKGEEESEESESLCGCVDCEHLTMSGWPDGIEAVQVEDGE